jgi:hypothetical protein
MANNNVNTQIGIIINEMITDIATLSAASATGVTNTFTDLDGSTLTVTGGLITAITP